MQKNTKEEVVLLEEQTEEILGVVAAMNIAVNYGPDDPKDYIGALGLVEKILRKQVVILQNLIV